LIGLVATFATAATGKNLDNWLRKLEPEERARQACMLKGLKDVTRDARLRQADRMKSSIFSPALLQGNHLVAKGGAVRAKGSWYALSFECDLQTGHLKASSFTFNLGDEIPKQKWEQLGLW